MNTPLCSGDVQQVLVVSSSLSRAGLGGGEGGGRETDWPRVEITARTDVLPRVAATCPSAPRRAGPTPRPLAEAALINRDDLENRYEEKKKVRSTCIIIYVARYRDLIWIICIHIYIYYYRYGR